MAIKNASTQPFPESGDYTIQFWAEFWGVTTETILEWMRKHDMHHWGPSQKCLLISADEFRNKFGGNING